jgi:hypothetical protein
MPTIGEFVEALAQDSALDKAFDQRPRRTAKKFGLSKTQIDRMMKGGIGSLRTQIENDLKPKKALVFRVKRG